MIIIATIIKPVKIRSPILFRSFGFSLVELVLTITLLGVLVSVFVVNTGSQSVAVADPKLEADVRQLNQMVNLYKADGGSLSSLTQVGDVLAKLKNHRSESTLKSHTGAASGSLLDARVEPVLGSGQAGRMRAVWNSPRQMFELSAGTQEGAFAFDFNAARAADAGQTDKREDLAVKYNAATGPGWVWGSVAKESAIPYRAPSSTGGTGQTRMFDPNQPKPSESGEGGSGGTGGTGGSGGGGDDGPDDPVPAVKLPAPNAIPSGGSYAYASFPGTVTLSANGAPAGESVLQYRINGGAWQAHSGGAISISPEDRLQARNIPAPGVTAYTASNVTTHEYYRLVAGFSGSSSAQFKDAQGTDGLVAEISSPEAGVTVFTHGDPQTDLGNGEIFETGEANVLTFKSASFNSIQPNAWFTAGNISMLNGEIYDNSDASSVTLQLDFNLNAPAGQNGTAQIQLELVSTPNTSDRLTSADIVRLANPTTDFTQTIEGVTYRLELRWRSTNPSAGVVQGAEFLIFEGGTASGQLQARFVSL